jgi:hypothetical protein
MDIFSIVLTIFVIFLISALIAYWIIAPIITAPFARSQAQDILEMIELTQIKSTDKFIDLGSGDGQIVLEVSKIAKLSVGVETNPFLVIYSRILDFFTANGPVKFINKSYFSVPLTTYDVVYLYLNPESLKKIKSKLLDECSPGTIIFSNIYPVPGWSPSKVRPRMISSQQKGNYYLYKIDEQK